MAKGGGSRASAEFKITGMDCAEEVTVLRNVIQPLDGVRELSFQILQGRMRVEFDAARVTTETIVRAVARTGMVASLWSQSAAADDATDTRYRSERTFAMLASGVFLVVGTVAQGLAHGWRSALGIDMRAGQTMAAQGLHICAAISGAWFVLPKAFQSLRRWRPDMNALMVVAICGAFAIGETFEAATVAFLFAVSLGLESWSVARARRAVAALMSMSPDMARVLKQDGTQTSTIVRDVAVGTRLAVHPGDKFPLDGKILVGETAVDQSPITGESRPIPKGPGMEVFAGTINQDGAVEIVSTRPAEDTTLARIIRLVGDAQSRRSTSEAWVSQFASYYTPIMMLVALLVMLIPPWLFHRPWGLSIYQGLALLVIACPCALVISTPVSIVAALTAAARRGVLVKGGPYMEVPGTLRAIAVDKTGTLTEGRPRVQKLVPLGQHSETELLSLAASIESRSEHPLAQAILREARSRKIAFEVADDIQAIQGKGATARILGREFWLGSPRYLRERCGRLPSIEEEIQKLEAAGQSTVVVGESEHVRGLIGLSDSIRPNARQAIEELRKSGIEHVVMLTGDNRAAGAAVAAAVGVDEVVSELLPEAKVAAIESLVLKFGKVAMIGDGVNDAPAMARASMGIAMGTAGTDAALETADVSLMGDNLRDVAWLIRLSRRTLTIIRQNVWAALGVKTLFMLLALFGQTSLWAAIAADMGTSFLVIINGLRLLHSDKLAVGSDVL